MLVNEPRPSSQGNLPLEHAGSRRLYRHWEALRAAMAAPARETLDLKPIARLVPNLGIIERPSPDADFIWRLAGTGLCTLLGREATGSRVVWGFDAFEADVVQRFLGGVVERLQPCVLKFNLINELGEVTPAELIGLPLLAAGGERMQALTGLFDFDDLGPRLGCRLTSIQLIAARSIWTEHLPDDSVVRRLEAVSQSKPQFQVILGGRG
jgi:hypothetical protein